MHQLQVEKLIGGLQGLQRAQAAQSRVEDVVPQRQRAAPCEVGVHHVRVGRVVRREARDEPLRLLRLGDDDKEGDRRVAEDQLHASLVRAVLQARAARRAGGALLQPSIEEPSCRRAIGRARVIKRGWGGGRGAHGLTGGGDFHADMRVVVFSLALLEQRAQL